MPMPTPTLLSGLVRRLGFAADGLRLMLKDSSYTKHLLATAAVAVAGLCLDLEAWEWVAVILCCGAVLAAETFNSAIEILCDRVTLDRDEYIRRTKDIAAGAVLTVSLTALAVGLIVFVRAILRLI